MRITVEVELFDGVKQLTGEFDSVNECKEWYAMELGMDMKDIKIIDIVYLHSVRPYLIVVETEFVRDTQIAMTAEVDPMGDEGWYDTTGEHVLGVYSAKSVDQAKAYVASTHHISAEIIKAYPLSSDFTETF